jgi:hypothetical protein
MRIVRFDKTLSGATLTWLESARSDSAHGVEAA